MQIQVAFVLCALCQFTLLSDACADSWSPFLKLRPFVSEQWAPAGTHLHR